MTALSRETFHKGMDFMSAAYGVASDPKRDGAFWHIINSIDEDAFRTAVTAYVKREDRFPTPAKLLEYAPRTVPKPQPLHQPKAWTGYDRDRMALCNAIMRDSLTNFQIADRIEIINEQYKGDSRRDSYVEVCDEINRYRNDLAS